MDVTLKNHNSFEQKSQKLHQFIYQGEYGGTASVMAEVNYVKNQALIRECLG